MSVVTLPTITIFGGSSSPWSVPGSWDSIQIAGVTYGVNSPPTTTLVTQEVAFGTTIQNVPTSQFAPVGGKVRIKGAERFYKIDIKDPQGSDGWTITYRGLRPKPFDIEFYIWTQAQFDYFVGSIIPAIQYSGTKRERAGAAGVPPVASRREYQPDVRSQDWGHRAN